MSSDVKKMEIRAPLSGVAVALDELPDPVFARRMVGDGVAIDPISDELLSPVSGEVTQLHDAHHALAVRADNGVEVLVHVGLDTVLLEGRGFTPLVARGARVACGQPLLRIDLDAVARGARSLLTAVVVTSTDRVARLAPAKGLLQAGESVALELELAQPADSQAPADAGELAVSDPIRLPNKVGLHARPAAVFADEAKKHPGAVWLARGETQVNAKSVIAILLLATRRGDALRVKASGPGAREAVAGLAKLLASGCGEDVRDAPEPPEDSAAAASPARPSAAEGELTGAPASPGVALGFVLQYRQAAIHVQEVGGPEDAERARLSAALREAARQTAALKQHSSERPRAQILEVQLALLEDPDLLGATDTFLRAGKSAGFAWQQALTGYARQLEQAGSPLLRERAADVRDVGRRVLALLAGTAEVKLVLPEGTLLVAEELTPSEMAGFDRSKLVGLCTTAGGSTSHVAILARSMGLPAICGVDEAVLRLADGTQVAIDGTNGVLRVRPDERCASQLRERIAHQAERRQSARSAAHTLGQTRDGHRVQVVANICTAKDAQEAIAAGAEGVGLLRSEFLFDGRDEAPTEAEQAAEYLAVATVLGKSRPLVVRTLDVGGDKPLPYLPLPKERNPFLGLRGVRVSLANPALFRTQLRAILAAAPAGDLHIMFPMVATLGELRAAKQILAEEQRAFPFSVKVGVMVEVPSAAVIAEVLAHEVDFFSIGTNDLTQYTLAMDRGHPKLAALADALDPAILRMIAMTVEGAHEHGKWVGLCGGLASEALATPLLVGLGIDELSVSLPDIGAIKAALGQYSYDECTDVATKALRLRSAAEIRAFLAEQAEGLEGRPLPKRDVS